MVTVLELLFRLSIFSLLAYTLYGLIKNYAYPFFIDQVVHEKNQQRELLEKDNLLGNTRHRIENQIDNQTKMFTLLERNVQVWHKCLQEETASLEATNQHIVERMVEFRKQQQRVLSLQNMVVLSVPQAIDKARVQLATMYQGQAGQQFVHRIVTQLASRSREPEN